MEPTTPKPMTANEVMQLVTAYGEAIIRGDHQARRHLYLRIWHELSVMVDIIERKTAA